MLIQKKSFEISKTGSASLYDNLLFIFECFLAKKTPSDVNNRRESTGQTAKISFQFSSSSSFLRCTSSNLAGLVAKYKRPLYYMGLSYVNGSLYCLRLSYVLLIMGPSYVYRGPYILLEAKNFSQKLINDGLSHSEIIPTSRKS